MGVAGIIIGVLALICVLVATFLLGSTGAIITAVLAAVAIVLAILKRTKDKRGGIPAIIIGVLAIVLAFSMSNAWSRAFSDLHQKALTYKPDGLWAQVSEDTNGGFLGIISKFPRDEAGMNSLVEEMNELNKLNGTQK